MSMLYTEFVCWNPNSQCSHIEMGSLRGDWAMRVGTVISGIQFSSVAQLRLTLCDPMDCSMPGPPVHHQLLEPTLIHVH